MQKKNKDNIRIDHLNAETITSLEIAEITGKMHKNVLQSIREMEPAWEKVHELKFQLSFITRELPNGGVKQEPM
ncbi:Rha family transcriptional regulator [Dysgonomonas sp. Marseille-P4361]|uniref:Rha family transcriptional regulator n=1 Tax=Dysgonomonas sp. Marseille-P4361 TaxID=2161820 RepID=UPI000D551B9E|nr:Rha family transcriptional regulator [Dysgonomonas sp. Marseille-P4361]